MKFTCALQSQVVQSHQFKQTIHQQYKGKTFFFEEVINFNQQMIDAKSNVVIYNQVKKQEINLDISQIIGAYFEDSSSTADLSYQKKVVSKSKKKDVVKKTFKKKKFKELPMLKINPLSKKIIENYEQGIQTQTQEKNQLDKFREKYKKQLLKCLCYGIQELKNKKIVLEEHEKMIVGLDQDQILKHLAQIVKTFDHAILKARQSNISSIPSIAFQSQWKFVIRMCSNPQNQLLRRSILNGSLNVQVIAYGSQEKLLQFLPKQKKQKLLAQYDYILRQSATEQKTKNVQEDIDPTLALQVSVQKSIPTYEDEQKQSFKRKGAASIQTNKQVSRKKPSKKTKK